MLTAPTIDIRTRIPEEIIRELVSRISSQFKPLRIILFGSYAHGIPRPESDVDLLVVMETQNRESAQALEIRRAIQPMFAVDLLVITPQRLAERLDWGDSFLKEIVEKGIVVYESADT
jgi:predicted nucleotidyltransferase